MIYLDGYAIIFGMSSRSGPIHVATTKRHYKGKVYQTHLLRRTYREDGKVKHETLGNISHLPAHVVALIRRSLKGEALVGPDDAFSCERSLPHGHVAAVLGTLRKLGVDRMIAAQRTPERDRVVAMIASRVIDPQSKLATARGLNEETAFSSLGEALRLESCTEDDLYAAMDWLQPKQGAIEKKLATRHLAEKTLVLYDVTSSYFEGRTCPLAKLGHNRDGKKGKLQVVFGLLCNVEGCPVAVEVFDGNTGDPTTLGPQIAKIRQRFGLKRVVLVGDRGMLTNARIREDIDPVEGLNWITALRAPAIRKLMEEREIHRSLFDETDLAEITSPEYPGQRLIACYNPLLAADRTRKRNDLLEATERELDKIVKATKRKRQRLRGKDKIGVRVGRVLNRFKMGKHFQIEITDDTFRHQRNATNIAAEEALDGIYIVRTDVPTKELSAEETVSAYKRLSVAERAFRSMKTVDLKVRPIHHRLAKRVRAHVFLCMLAYYVEWHMRQALAPILFDDDDPQDAAQLRQSVVAPAQRSSRAIAKAHTKRTPEGQSVHSFQTLLKDLATIVKNRMTPKTDPNATPFDLLTTPTPTQRRALDLLGVPLKL